jgi:hypothetical protein
MGPRGMFRRLSLFSLLFTVAFTAGACKDETEAEPDAKDDRRVVASEESKQAFGVESWYVEPGDPGRVWVAGLDREGNTMLDVVLAIDAVHPYEGSASYDVHGKVTAHVTIRWAGDDITSNAGDLGEAEQTAALDVFERIEADLGTATGTVGASHLTKACAPSLALRGGHVGGPLVRQQQDILRDGECLIDNSGNRCGWLAIKIGWSLIKMATCFRGNLKNCVMGPKKLYDTAKEAEEQGCRYRPCR